MMVRETGLEPVRPKTHAPQACLSAIPALSHLLYYYILQLDLLSTHF